MKDIHYIMWIFYIQFIYKRWKWYIQNNMVENIINNDNNNDYSVPNYKSINQDKKEEDKSEGINNDIKEEFICYNYK